MFKDLNIEWRPDGTPWSMHVDDGDEDWMNSGKGDALWEFLELLTKMGLS